MEIQTLKEIYSRYEAEAAAVRAKASVFDGLFGMGDDPRKDPCHMRFYEGVEQWAKGFLAEGPEEPAAYEAVSWILSAPADHEGEAVYWFLYAAQGLCRDLIPTLSPEHCVQLRDFYDAHYPRRDRMPVQKEVYRLLKKGSKA